MKRVCDGASGVERKKTKRFTYGRQEDICISMFVSTSETWSVAVDICHIP